MAEPRELTEQQRRIFDFIQWHLRTQQVSPTVREIAGFLGSKSTNGVNDHLNALQKKGWINRGVRKARSIRVLRVPADDVGLLLRRWWDWQKGVQELAPDDLMEDTARVLGKMGLR
jgi:SOS-response transcriptional repressor LexA